MWGFYFNELIRSLPFFLKGLYMTVAVSGLSLVLGTIIGFFGGILRAGRNNLASGWARITVTSGAGVLVYASVVDNRTNDATTIPMKR